MPPHLPRAPHQPLLSPAAPGPESLCLRSGPHSRSKAREAKWAHGRPGVTWAQGTGWRDSSHPRGVNQHAYFCDPCSAARNSEQPAFLLGAQAEAASSALGTPELAGLGGSQACSVLAMSTSRMSGDSNSRPCRYTSSPWKQAGHDDQVSSPWAPGEMPSQPGINEGQDREASRNKAWMS